MSISTLTPKTQARPYLTIIPNRSPREKTHVNIGHAKNAVQAKMSYRGAYGYANYQTTVHIAVYEWLDNQWSLLWDIPSGTPESKLPWKGDK
jgi:hypothetical protein